MGHDVYAVPNGRQARIEREDRRREHEDAILFKETDRDIGGLYAAWCETAVAYLHRPIADPMARSLAIALGLDDLWCGTQLFSRQQIADTITLLVRDAESFSQLRVAGSVKSIVDQASAGDPDAAVGRGEQSTRPEIEFLNACIEEMDRTGIDEIDITFY